MKKEFTTALLKSTTSIMPSELETFELIKKSRSGLLFRKVPDCPDEMYYFVCIYPGKKWEEICVYLGWTRDGSEPSPLISDPKALDYRGKEYELDDFRISLGRVAGDWTKHYTIVRPDCCLDVLEMLTRPIENELAQRLVEPCVLKINADLKRFALNYFEWATLMRNAKGK